MADAALFNIDEVCRFFGGAENPIDRSTLYRGIAAGVYPKPIKIGPKIARWRKTECQAALRKMIQKSKTKRGSA